MRALLYQVVIVPPQIKEQFGANNFYNFGRIAFTYPRTPTANVSGLLFTGPTHWLEHVQGIVIPEFPDVLYIEWCIKPNVTINWCIDAGVSSTGVGAAINGTVQSMIKNQRSSLH